jgi:hypothetical protein
MRGSKDSDPVPHDPAYYEALGRYTAANERAEACLKARLDHINAARGLLRSDGLRHEMDLPRALGELQSALALDTEARACFDAANAAAPACGKPAVGWIPVPLGTSFVNPRKRRSQ